jgi:hypothetical protein
MLTATSGASVLSTDSNSPPVTQTTVSPNLLKTLNIITKLSIDVLGKDLGVLSCLEILLSVQKPKGDLELTRILNDGHDLFDLISSEFSTSLVDIDFRLLANQVSKSTSKTLDFRQAKDDITLSLYVRIENTQNVLKFRSLHQRGRPVCSAIPRRK